MELREPEAETPTWQRKQPSSNWLKRNFWALVMVIGVAAVCFLIVHFFKKPGQMTVLESQAMDMSGMEPPAGAVPVAIMPVKESEIEGSVTYTGTVQAYEDEDVFPRITGRIVRMPVYPGDRVKKNQLLVELDPPDRSEYSEKATESQFAAEAAMHNAGIAEEELKQKRYELEAAKAAQSAAADELTQAKADLDYWTPEIKRQETLLKTQVVSQQEYEDELAKFRGAQARVKQLQAKLMQAKNTELAAQAALDGELHHVGHTALASKEASAAARTAGIVDSYTKIVARSNGVVTKRIVSPGVLVNPGTLILKVSHINKVRLQAEVASSDASKLAIGSPVYVKAAENSDQELKAKITSIFPAADVSTRTLVVEALVDNIGPRLSKSLQDSQEVQNLDDFRMLPGEYVVMRLGTGRKKALTIPTNAVVWREGKPSAWKAVGGRGGRQSAQLVPITIGLADDKRTEVTRGFSAGDEVIYEGYSSLQNGAPVVATEWGEEGPAKLPDTAEVVDNRLTAGNKWTAEGSYRDWKVHLTMSPDPPAASNNKIVCRIVDGKGNAVTGARLIAKTLMPTMSMSGPSLSGAERSPGQYVLASNFSSGLWQADISINGGAGAKPLSFEFEIP